MCVSAGTDLHMWRPLGSLHMKTTRGLDNELLYVFTEGLNLQYIFSLIYNKMHVITKTDLKKKVLIHTPKSEYII